MASRTAPRLVLNRAAKSRSEGNRSPAITAFKNIGDQMVGDLVMFLQTWVCPVWSVQIGLTRTRNPTVYRKIRKFLLREVTSH